MSSIRVVPVPGAIERIDTFDLMAELADEIADDAQTNADRNSNTQSSGRLQLAIGVVEVSQTRARIAANPRNPRSNAGSKAYAWYVEKGTSDTKAEPFLAPAAYIYRRP